MNSAPAFLSTAGKLLFASHEANTDFRMLLLRHCKNLTILLLVVISCIPFKPWQALTLCAGTTLILYPGLIIIPEYAGVQNLDMPNNQIIYLIIMSLILTGISTFLYHSRHVMYMARKKADEYVDSFYEPDAADSENQEFDHDRELLEKDIHTEERQWVSEISVDSVDKIFLDEVKKVIEEHIGDSNFGVEWLAHEVAISPRQLQRRLKSAVGLSAGSLIRVMRLQRSAQLIQQNAGNISEVAYKIGFNDPNYFSKIFRRRYGMNPSAYSKMINNKLD